MLRDQKQYFFAIFKIQVVFFKDSVFRMAKQVMIVENVETVARYYFISYEDSLCPSRGIYKRLSNQPLAHRFCWETSSMPPKAAPIVYRGPVHFVE